MRPWAWVALLGGFGPCWGCSDPSLDIPRGSRPVLALELLSGAEAAAVPLVFRGRIEGAVSARDAAPFLFEGELSDYHQSSLRRGALSEPLRARALPLRFWAEEGALLMQPQVFLSPGQLYTLALSGYGEVGQLRARAESARWARLFPSPGVPIRTSAVYCGVTAAVERMTLTLEPGAVPAEVSAGIFGEEAAGCFTISARGSAGDACLPPPEVAGLPLEPSPFEFGGGLKGGDETICKREHIQLAGTCAEVLDDRLLLMPHSEDLLWVLTEPEPRLVVARRGLRTLLLRGLAPDTGFQVRGFVVAADGARRELAETLRTTQARRHVVLNEVLADALGKEPESEWIEIVNDSASAAALLGLFLEDAGGAVPIPDVTLEAGELAVLLSEGYRESGLDVPVPTQVRRIRMPSLGVRGLSNSGEALLLVGHEGVVSRFPMVPSRHPGVSIARTDPAAADDDPRSFVEHAAPGASPGHQNGFDE